MADQKQRSILVVDDNADLLEALQFLFLENGFAVDVAESGARALALIKSGTRPDLIVLDVRMPEMSGPQFLDELEKQYRQVLDEVPVVFSSAGKPPVDARVVGFIDKMTDMGDYLKKIRSFLEDRRSLSA